MSSNGTYSELTAPSHTEQFCTFYVGDVLLGIEVVRVQEVILSQAMTPMPLASDVVSGLMNLRGQIVTAIDLRKRLGMPPREDNRAPMHVVVKNGESTYSLLVDEIGNVVTVDSQNFEQAPETLSGPARELTTGVFKLEDQLLIALDSERATTLIDPAND